MAPKKKRGKKNEESKKYVCSGPAPGPKYKLKSVVGYNDHCASRYRNPAYSIAARQTGGTCTIGPGPIYYVKLPKAGGFSMGRALRGGGTKGGPGPYLIPDPKPTPAFSIKWRTQPRSGGVGGGLYNLPGGPNGPAFTIAVRPTGERCAGGPGPSPPLNINVVKPKSPAYTMGYRQTNSSKCGGPGPGNAWQFPKWPAYSFGIKRHPCMPPYITECDEQC